MDTYRAKWLLPITSPPVENGAITIDHGRIIQTGSGRGQTGSSVHDLGECILLPGLINAHTHLELTCYLGRVAPAPLWTWFSHLMPIRFAPGADALERAAVSEGARQSLAAGVTCVGDISRAGVQVQELRSSPLRKVCFLELISGALAPPNDAATLTAMLREAAASGEPERLVIGLSPHALYTVTWPDLLAASRLAAEADVPVTIHVLETPEEADWLAGHGQFLHDFLVRCRLPTADDDTAGSAMERLRRSGLFERRPLLAHVNYLDDAELTLLAASGASVAYCPRSHNFFGHPPHRWRDMLAAGINVCLGTDSLASNYSLSILDELRFVRQAAPEFPTAPLLEMATIRSAVALRLDPFIGSLDAGKRADFITIPWNSSGPAEPAANLLDGGQTVSGVWVDGKSVP